MKIVSLIFMITLFFSININAAEIGSKHELGLSFIGSHEYEEPKIMNLRSGSQAADDHIGNLGFLYNYKKGFLNNSNSLNEFEFDASYLFLTQSYWSATTGLMEDIDVETYNVRGLYGLQLSDKLMLKSGLGYRHLYHFWQNRQSTTGAFGYDREQDYIYIPIVAEINMPIPELKLDGKLNIEFDHIMEGNNTSYFGYLGGANQDTDFENNDGYAWKVSYEGKKGNLIIEPYYEFMYVETSNVANDLNEPANTTTEIGLRVKKEFNSNRSKAPEMDEILKNDNYYFGVQLLRSKIDNGLTDFTGTATENERDYGYSIVTGMKILDDTRGKLALELAYNQFGHSIASANNGDEFITDGRLRNGAFSRDRTITIEGNNFTHEIESYSTSLGLKPTLEMLDSYINLNFGLHRYSQFETDIFLGANPTFNTYEGVDVYHGIGLGHDRGNLSLSVDYLEHDMYYDAKSISASLKYNF